VRTSFMDGPLWHFCAFVFRTVR